MLKDLQDKHKNKMAFIVCAGPSLHFENVELLKDYITIAVNSAVLKVPFCDYFVSDDEGITRWNYYIEDLPLLNCRCLLYEDKLKKLAYHIHPDRVIFFKHKLWYNPKTKTKDPKGLVLTKDASLPIIGARTSTGTAIHLAYIMGCNPIVLVGNDCCYKDYKRYYWEFSGEKKVTAAKSNKFDLVKLPLKLKQNKIIDKHCDDFLVYFKALENSMRQQKDLDLDLINISTGLFQLEFGENYESLEQVIKIYGDKKDDR